MSALALQFQGGFCGKECEIEVDGDKKVMDFYPDDANKLQTFQFKERIQRKDSRKGFSERTQ